MPPESGTSVGKPELASGSPQFFTWEEIGLRTGKGEFKEERWLVIRRKIYDISQFHLRHPGGTRVISHYAGQDATVRACSGAWGPRAFGKNHSLAAKRLLCMHDVPGSILVLPIISVDFK